MELLAGFLVFAAAMIFVLIKGYTMVIALVIGLAAFLAAGMRRGNSFKSLCIMAVKGAGESLGVVKVLCLIGFITALWRAGGTIAVFVYYGVKIITPSLFLIIAFLLSSLLSYAIGTSFGVAGTVGVILMTLARSGGVDPVLTAGVLMSGIYFGDRSSPVSSSANMVAGITGTKIFDNVRQMMKTGLFPFILCCIVYTVMSFMNPVKMIDDSVVAAFKMDFDLSLWTFLPALVMLLLPVFKVDVMIAMVLSILSSAVVAWQVQGMGIVEIIRLCIFGYDGEGTYLDDLLNGGGLVSMLEIMIILLISCAYSGIFNGTKMLDGLEHMLEQACTKIGRFSVMVLISLASLIIFCNQTIASLMCVDLLKKSYENAGALKQELAIDVENSVIVISGAIPWAIACSVPLSFFGVGYGAIAYAVYLYAVPVCYYFTKKIWYGNDRVRNLEISEGKI